MHNLHFIMTKADSATQAANIVKQELAGWGDENNWYSIGGIAAEDGKDDIENLEDARWGLSFVRKDGAKTCFSQVGDYVRKLIDAPITLEYGNHGEQKDFVTAIKTIIAELDGFCQQLDTANEKMLWAASQNIIYLYGIFGARKKLAAGEELPELFGWQFNQCGLTDMSYFNDGTQRYIVFLDMHS